MYKLKHAIIYILILLFTISAYAGAETDKERAVKSAQIIFYTAMAEVGKWGAEDGISGLSFTGKWLTPNGTPVAVDAIGTDYRLRMDFGHGYHMDDWLRIEGSTIRGQQIPVMERSTYRPNFAIEGEFLSLWMPKGAKDYTDAVAFSKVKDGLIATVQCPDGAFRGLLYKREADRIVDTTSQGDQHTIWKVAGPNDRAPANAWKTLKEDSATSLWLLCLGTLMYSEDCSGKLPSMQNPKQLYRDLIPYVKEDSDFVQAGTDTPFECNPAFSGKKISGIKASDQRVFFYQSKPSPDGTRCVALAYTIFGNGNRKGIKIVSATDWEKLAKRNHLK